MSSKSAWAYILVASPTPVASSLLGCIGYLQGQALAFIKQSDCAARMTFETFSSYEKAHKILHGGEQVSGGAGLGLRWTSEHETLLGAVLPEH